jgi:hypothetical protein
LLSSAYHVSRADLSTCELNSPMCYVDGFNNNKNLINNNSVHLASTLLKINIVAC